MAVGLVVAAVGYLLSGWLRTAAVTGVLIALLLASFLLNSLGPLFHLPRMLMRFSIFEAYAARRSWTDCACQAPWVARRRAAALTIAAVRFAQGSQG